MREKKKNTRRKRIRRVIQHMNATNSRIFIHKFFFTFNLNIKLKISLIKNYLY